MISHSFDQFQIVRKLMCACASAKPRVYIFAIRTNRAIHGGKFFKNIIVLKQTYLVQPHFHRFAYKLIDPFKRIGPAFNMNMSIYRVSPPVRENRK